MKIYRHLDDDGKPSRYFDVSNIFLTRRGAVRVVKSIPNVEMLRVPRYFQDNEAFCEFKLNNKKFILIEPYGDNSRFEIVCDEEYTKELEQIASTFETHKFDALSVMRWFVLVLPLSYLVFDKCL